MSVSVASHHAVADRDGGAGPSDPEADRDRPTGCSSTEYFFSLSGLAPAPNPGVCSIGVRHPPLPRDVSPQPNASGHCSLRSAKPSGTSPHADTRTRIVRWRSLIGIGHACPSRHDRPRASFGIMPRCLRPGAIETSVGNASLPGRPTLSAILVYQSASVQVGGVISPALILSTIAHASPDTSP